MPLRASSHPGSPNSPSCSALAWYSCWPGLSPWGESWKRTRVARTAALTRYHYATQPTNNSVGFFGQAEGLYPNLPSFMCVFSGWSCTRDDQSFIERVANFLMTIFFTTAASFFREYKNNDIDGLVQIASEIDQSIIVINADFILEYPRPLMPYVFLISGLHIDEPKPLPTNFAKFMEDSAPHGLIVFSLGTQIDKCSADLAEVLGRVFGRLRQRVIWKHKGEPPSTLSNNTMITPWFPQNDILAHPLTKLFITHCGAQSTYEAAYHGVPVIAIPLMADQFGHASSLVHRAKMGLQLDLRDLQEETLETAIHEVLDNPMYKKNAKAVSELQADQLMPPRERFIHLVNYVIRHRGAKHLISKAAIRLNAFQLYSIDVIAFLLAIVTLIAVAVCCCMRHTCCRKPTSKHKRD